MNKVLHVLPMNKMSGAERMALLLCKNLKNYEPIVVCGGKELSDVFKDNGIESYNIRFFNKRILNNLSDLKKIIKENNIKIIHAHDNNASLNAYLVKKLYRLDVKVISHIHSCYPFLKVNGFNKKIDKILRPRYDHNIACGKLVYDFYKENTTYFKEEKASILSNAIDIDEINKINNNESYKLLEEFNIPKDKTILGFVGRICEIKGIVPFIKEIAKYKDNFNDCKVILVGSGGQEEEVRFLIKELNLEELFIITGFQDNVYKFYPIIDVFFLPSNYEGLPMVLLEAMSFKKPVVSMNVGSINEIIKDKETGVLIEEGNYKEFILRLKEVKEEKLIREKLGKNAFKYISKNYDIKNYIEYIEKMYDKQMR
ncbi:glycosyltransferase family 4 protein [Clostridium sp. D53t1_180928_C8]|uniref:glycosyltransferase family 4 protein n=1 Tax=Clostridium sp. D53t1_180928_C8 TaxID=2787101 RepID=UPI0018A9E67B|nr:glycosyltransferase family 4 protein [Clostridium sp. D53t1_180928_C8]